MRIAVLCNDRLALPALRLLIQNKLVVAVGTPNRESEFRMVIKEVCRQGGVPLQVFAQKELESSLSTWLHLHRADVVLVKTFPWKIPSELLAVPTHGFINFHYAPLPEWRGPSPLFWMIRNGAKEIGVSVHRMDRDFDAGDILLQNRVPLSPELTMGMCTAQLAFMGADLSAQLVQGLHTESLRPVAQDHAKAGWFARPGAADVRINWDTMTAEEIKALVKACNPSLKGAATSYKGWTFGLTETSLSNYPLPAETQPGTLLCLDKSHGLVIACRDQKALCAEVLYMEEGYLPGTSLAMFGLTPGERLGT
jgi:methionyl-tRNA formyltransferase